MRLLTRRRRTEDPAALRAEIDSLSARNRAQRDAGTERQLLRLRHELGRRLLAAAGEHPDQPEPDLTALPDAGGVPECTPERLTAGLVRAAVLRDGCLLVRGLLPRDEALAFAGDIEAAFTARERGDTGDGTYEEFVPHPDFTAVIDRQWMRDGGGVLAVDSPRLMARMLDLFAAAGVPELVAEYLAEPPVLSVQKTTLRRADPEVAGGWHQDGKFMGDVRALNLWTALSRCGDVAPGLDLVPRRLDGYAETATDEAVLPYQVSQRAALAAAGDTPVVRPVFEPGDALFFDERLLHKTGSDPGMPHPRYAIESWFFGPSGFQPEFAPVGI